MRKQDLIARDEPSLLLNLRPETLVDPARTRLEFLTSECSGPWTYGIIWTLSTMTWKRSRREKDGIKWL